jgi:hypothetical protein
MTLFSDSPDTAFSPSAPTDACRRTPDRENGRRNQVSAQADASCLRCGGFLVLSYMAALEFDHTGRPMKLWRCINCGNCVDHDILVNREKGSGSVRPCAKPRRGFQASDGPRSETKHNVVRAGFIS